MVEMHLQSVKSQFMKPDVFIHSQGLEFDYTGVIIGDDMRFENGKVITDYTKRAKTDNSLKGIKH